MRKYQYEKLAMYQMVKQIMEASATSWGGLPALDNAFSALSNKLVLVQGFAQEQGSNHSRGFRPEGIYSRRSCT